jgi:transcriptional regulator with GAF, ATPase, and Fis domain
VKEQHSVARQMRSQQGWFYFYGDDRAVEDKIRTGLAAAGVALCPVQESPQGHGIVCFSQADGQLWNLLGALRRGNRGLVIALAAPPFSPEPGMTWRLLEQGASEVLAWDDGSDVASQIRARLERWTTVDGLVEFFASRAALVGESNAWRSLIRKLAEIGRFTNAPVLLIGESGTGKELLARLISLLDARAANYPDSIPELVVFDCSTIVPELSGSELFGHERGAFTGAVNSRDGAFSLAHGRTLFLDEIGELPLPLQAQLLRAVQEKKYKRVGGNIWQTSDFRLVCATNRNLQQLIQEGKFRLDLYHRISGWVFETMPLRERREDILPLASFFMKELYPQEISPSFGPAVKQYLLNKDYPGNVRELRHLIQRIAHRHVGPEAITAGDIPEEDRPAGGELPRAWPNAQFDKTMSDAILVGAGLREITQITTETAIRLALQSENGNLQRAASKLGVTDRALQLRKASGRISATGNSFGWLGDPGVAVGAGFSRHERP